MKGTIENQILAGKAYTIFRSEVEKHLAQVGNIFANMEHPEQQAVQSLSASFHTIKGGAGFFGLSEIAGVASTLEHLLQEDIARIEANLTTIKELVGKLGNLAEELPPAKEV